jgi:broad specificity phosphatase PhoE
MISQAVQTRLLLLSRGEVEWAEADDGDPPLSEAGLVAVELAAATLPRYTHIAASPQRASRQTAETLSAIRGVPLWWRDDLDELRTAAPRGDLAAYHGWLDGLFDSFGDGPGGEAPADGVHRLTVALRAIGDQHYGRTVLVVSHPVIILGFRAHEMHLSMTRDQIETLPDLALAIVDYLEGRFYMVEDFPVRWKPAGV